MKLQLITDKNLIRETLVLSHNMSNLNKNVRRFFREIAGLAFLDSRQLINAFLRFFFRFFYRAEDRKMSNVAPLWRR